jgi:uncharacterized protein (DUF983 family)
MSAVMCPNCKHALHWQTLRAEFACPQCAAPLAARTTGPFVTTFVIWTVVEIPVKAFIYATFGDNLGSLVTFALISFAIGWGLATVIVGGFSTVTSRDEPRTNGAA